MKLRNILALGFLLVGSGCGTMLSGTRTPGIYQGVAFDAQALWVLDMPFSLVADTLCLPYDLTQLRYRNRVPHPLATWKQLPGEPHPFDLRLHPKMPRAYQPDQAIADDVKQYMGEEKLKGDTPMYYEDGTGQHAVLIKTNNGRGSWDHVLFYDRSNVRKKKMKFMTAGSGFC